MAGVPINKKGIALYYQVEESIRTMVESGKWPLGTKLPTEDELSNYFSVSRTTIRQAINRMVEAGILVRKQGSGTYVTSLPYARKRLNAQPSDSVCKYIYTPILQNDTEYSYQNFLLANLAHVLMLYRQKLLSSGEAGKLLQLILSLRDKHPNVIDCNPLNEDLYLNFEQYLIAGLGIDVGGKIHTARSRNDLTPTVTRMSIRDSYFILCDRLLMLRKQLLALAENNRGRILPGYTHLQPSQPITLDHYFLGIAEALERDFNRLSAAYSSLNRSPLGSCAMAGPSFPIDRQYTASLLGFDGIIVNSLDAVASRDCLLELTADFATMGSTISRFVQDLYIWSTAEFNYVEFSDSVCCCSSIMPQKKNPLSIEHIKSKTAHLASSYIDVFMCLKGTSYSHSRDLFECMTPFWDSVHETQAILDLLMDALQDITFHYDRMEKMANDNDVLLTDLADTLVRTDSLPFRSAHNIVSSAMRLYKKHGNEKLSLKYLNESCKNLYGHNTSLTEAELASILTAQTSIFSKRSEGSPSEDSCARMLGAMKERLTANNTALQNLMASVSAAEQRLLDEAEAIIKETDNQ